MVFKRLFTAFNAKQGDLRIINFSGVISQNIRPSGEFSFEVRSAESLLFQFSSAICFCFFKQKAIVLPILR